MSSLSFPSFFKRECNFVLKLNAARLYGKEKNVEDFKVAVETLNSLQTNAQVLQNSKLNKTFGQEKNIEDTKKYLMRTGISIEEWENQIPVIHVSGTKGKGSTCAMCESILKFHGYKTGFFSSPHLISVRERIRVDHSPLSEVDFTRHFWNVYNKLNSQKEAKNDMPAYFKFLTVMAFNVFLAEKVDVAIIEVGIGGEYDCTNVFIKTPVVGISSLGLDHTGLLGNTLEQIAWQKGGILKPGALAFTSPQPIAALNVLEQRALERECSLWEVPPLIDYDWESQNILLGLKGKAQAINGSLALQLAHAWINRVQLDKSGIGMLGLSKPVKVNQTTAKALWSCQWPGRFQILNKKSIDGNFTYCLDGAHTRESMELCAEWFNDLSNLTSRDMCQFILIYNMTGDRNASDLMYPLVSCNFNSVFFCPNMLNSECKRSDQTNHLLGSSELLHRCEENRNTWLCLEEQNNIFSNDVRTFVSVNETLKYIESRGGEQRVLVTGSLHLVGAVLSLLEQDLKYSTCQSLSEVLN